ncbi:hypothetical protein [Yersinia aldovae]|uniref:hypothetical protein n=1 Tax=Yersinia aldovae TaxID=29483 RepID=UPI0005AD4581|nr:hypothetical protein [Yersinia aldovae]AJJ62922.1 hypothetical protein AT01_1336 [Yersinia aldovae 670-83]
MKELNSFTVEEIEEIISSCQQEIHNTPTSDEFPVSPRLLLSLARIALAAKSGDLFIGMDIGVDVSTCEADALNRYYGTITEVSELETKKNGVILLVQDAEPNFTTTPQLNSPEIPDGWPTEDMVIAGFESGAWDALSSAVLKRQGWPYSCRESAECVTGIFKAMLAAAPEKPL